MKKEKYLPEVLRTIYDTLRKVIKEYYTKLSRSMKRKEKEFDKDIEQFKKYLEFEKMIR